jgi:hypothetical protein
MEGRSSEGALDGLAAFLKSIFAGRRHPTQSPWAFALPSLILDVVAVGGVSFDIVASRLKDERESGR